MYSLYYLIGIIGYLLGQIKRSWLVDNASVYAHKFLFWNLSIAVFVYCFYKLTHFLIFNFTSASQWQKSILNESENLIRLKLPRAVNVIFPENILDSLL